MVQGPPRPVQARRVLRESGVLPRGEWARLLSRLRGRATETDEYPDITRIAECHRACWASYVPVSLHPGEGSCARARAGHWSWHGFRLGCARTGFRDTTQSACWNCYRGDG